MTTLISPDAVPKLRLGAYVGLWAACMVLCTLLVASPKPAAAIASDITGVAVVLIGACLIRRQIRGKQTKPPQIKDAANAGLDSGERRRLAQIEKALTHNQAFGWMFTRALGGRQLGEWSGSWRTQDHYWWRELARQVGIVLLYSYVLTIIADIIALIVVAPGGPF